MALMRYRPVQYPSHFAVIDHGPAVKSGNRPATVAITQGRGAGRTVPLFVQDGDPDDPRTVTKVVFRTGGNTEADRDAAIAHAAERNREDDPRRPDHLEA